MPVASVAIVNTGGANLASLRYALERIGAESLATSDANTIRNASHVLLPGVGAAGDAMRRLKQLELIDVLRDLQQPVLGICLGLQLLARDSEEDARCLGILNETVVRLPAAPQAPVPHMGWNRIRVLCDSPLLKKLPDAAYFYFVHSYALQPAASCVASSTHGIEFAAIVEHGNFFGTQFHPERSAANGARLLRNFLDIG